MKDVSVNNVSCEGSLLWQLLFKIYKFVLIGMNKNLIGVSISGKTNIQLSMTETLSGNSNPLRSSDWP